MARLRKTVVVRLDRDQVDQLNDMAARRGVHRSSVLRTLVRERLATNRST